MEKYMQQTSSIVVHTTKLNKKTNEQEPIKQVYTKKFPGAFESLADVEFLRKVHSETRSAIGEILELLKKDFFTVLKFKANDNIRAMTLFELFGGHDFLGGTVDDPQNPGNKVRVEVTYKKNPVNISINTYPCREIFNKKTNLLGITTVDIIKKIEDRLTKLCGEKVTVPVYYVNEVLYNSIDSVLKNYVNRKCNKFKGGHDRSWEKCCKEVAEKMGENDVESEILTKQMMYIGVQLTALANGGKPTLPKEWKCHFTYKLVDIRAKVPEPTNIKQFNLAYSNALELFKKEVIDHFPDCEHYTLMKCPMSDIDVDHTDYSRYYDTSVKLTALPSREGSKNVKLRIRTRSGHTENYYPENLKESISGTPQINIWFPDAPSEDMCLPDSCHTMAKHNPICNIAVTVPSCEVEFNADVFAEHGIGCDINLANYLINTTLKLSEIPKKGNYVDFTYWLAKFKEQRPDNIIFSENAPTRLVREINYLVNHAKDKNRTAASVLLVGVREGNHDADKHNWHPSPDYLHTFFTWLLDKDFNEGQRSVIRMTRTVRNDIRLIQTYVLRRYVEQSKWDKTHDINVDKFSESELGRELQHTINQLTDNLEQTIQQLITLELINNIPDQRSQFYVMENINLNEIRNDSHVVSLYRTAMKDWGMVGGKLTSDRQKNTITFKCKDPTVQVNVESTEYWTVDKVVKKDDTTLVLAKPTERFCRQVIQDRVDGYLKKMLRISGIRTYIESRCAKLGKLMTTVDPKHTSQICHVCNDTKRIAKKSASYTKEVCAEKNINFRDGRIFICGNPNCIAHGTEQNADENAAHNILQKIFQKKTKKK